MNGKAPRRVWADCLDLNHARQFRMAMPRRRISLRGRPGEVLESLARHAILLADANRLEAPAAHIAANRPDLKTQAVRDLFERIQGGVVGHHSIMLQLHLYVKRIHPYNDIYGMTVNSANTAH